MGTDPKTDQPITMIDRRLNFLNARNVVAVHHHGKGDYQISKKIPIPGQGGWDYLTVDEGARRLYVSHGTQVEVLDVDSGAIVGSIPKTPGVHGVANAAELGRGFVSNGQSSTVTIFDLKTLKPIADVPTGQKADAITYDPATSTGNSSRSSCAGRSSTAWWET